METYVKPPITNNENVLQFARPLPTDLHFCSEPDARVQVTGPRRWSWQDPKLGRIKFMVGDQVGLSSTRRVCGGSIESWQKVFWICLAQADGIVVTAAVVSESCFRKLTPREQVSRHTSAMLYDLLCYTTRECHEPLFEFCFDADNRDSVRSLDDATMTGRILLA